MIPREPTEHGARGRGHAHRAAAGTDAAALSGEKLPPAADAAQALALAVAARAAAAAGRRRARGVRARRRARATARRDDDGSSTTTTPSTTTAGHRRRRSTTSTGKTFMRGELDARRATASTSTSGASACATPRRGRRRRRDGDPPAGAVLHDGDTVLLKVLARARRTIPNVVGTTGPTRAGSSGPTSTIDREAEASDVVDKGKVTRTDPAAARRCRSGRSVTIWVSTGPAQVQVPNLTGRTEDEARATLASAGLIVHEPPGSRCSDDVEVGQVAKQTPDTGDARAARAPRSASTSPTARAPSTCRTCAARTVDQAVAAPPDGDRCRNTRSSTRRSASRAQDGDRARPGHRGHEREAVPGRRSRSGQLDTSRRRRPTDAAVTPRVRIAVVAGGRSSEHAISLASARSVIEALDPARYDVVTLLIDDAGGWQVVDGAAALLAAARGRAAGASSRPAAGRRSCPGRGGGALVGANGATPGEIDVVFPVLHGPVRRGRHDPGPARDARAARTSAPACSGRPRAWTRPSARPCCATRASRSRARSCCGTASTIRSIPP